MDKVQGCIVLPRLMPKAMQTNSSDNRPEYGVTAQLAQRLGITTGRIRELRTKSNAIDEICDDYEECNSRLEKLEQMGEADSLQAKDYRELKDQLERELEQHLEH